MNDLEREGMVQRFKYTFELAWKTLRDRLDLRYDPLIRHIEAVGVVIYQRPTP